jgi:DNA modification methylase
MSARKALRPSQRTQSRSRPAKKSVTKRPAKSPLLPQRFEPQNWFGYVEKVPWAVVQGDAEQVLRKLTPNSVDCVVTSPPYYWQRDYGVDGQLGQEDSAEEYVRSMVRVFKQVRRVLKDTGLAFVVLGDTYYSGRGQPKGNDPKQAWRNVARKKYRAVDRPGMGLPRKSLMGMPWRVALALQADGWVLRSAVTWRKSKPLAEPSVHDRPWNGTEQVFILAKKSKYYFDRRGLDGEEDIWEIAAKNASRAFKHAAPFPEELVERCLACGCKRKGTVLDPFAGSGTTLAVASRSGRPSVGIELNPEYVSMARKRIIFRRPKKRK